MDTKQLKQLVIVLSASCYSIVNDTTGEVENEGCTVRFCYTDSLAPCADNDKKSAGYKPAKATVPLGAFKDFKVVPALYETTLDFSVDSQGKSAIKAKDFRFISGISVEATDTEIDIGL
jgi:hypothetical protein